MKTIRKADLLILFFFFLLYFGVLFVKTPQVYSYRFDSSLVEKYKRSQDITHGVENRVHISDNDIYIASGYLYAIGEDPTKYNFQHPPLIKYLFGFSAKYLRNPYPVQIIFAMGLIFLTYILGLLIFKNRSISVLAIFMLVFDPAFLEVTSNALLDLGQAVFMLMYLIFAVFYPKKTKLQGLTLGLLLASKFWTTAVFFVAIIWGYKLFTKVKIDYWKLLYSFAIGFVVYLLFYVKTYLIFGRYFDIFFFEAKTLKFMLNHNSANLLAGPLRLFLTGNFNNWWDFQVVRSNVWSVFWPISLLVVMVGLFRKKSKKYENLLYILPISYFVFSITQVPFTRYFVIVLPFLYLGSANILNVLLQKNNFTHKYVKILSA